MRRPVLWAADATRDTLDILRHIAEDDPDVAERIVDLIEVAGYRLGEIPTGRPGRVRGTFEKSLAPLPWILCYAVEEGFGEQRILILRVIHTARTGRKGIGPEAHERPRLSVALRSPSPATSKPP